MVNREKANEAAEAFARTTRDSYERVLDHAAAMQERNVRFVWEMANNSIAELRERAESNRAMARELGERVDRQRDAFRKVIEESFGVYVDLAFAPLSHYREGLTVADRAAR